MSEQSKCLVCKRLKPFKKAEEEEIRNFADSFKKEFHTGRLSTRLLRLPHSTCECLEKVNK